MMRLFGGLAALFGACVLCNAAEDPARPDPKPAKTAPDKADKAEPGKEPAKSDAEPEDPAKLRDRIVEDAKEAGKRLGDKDPGPDTLRLQKDALKNIDKLLQQAQNPPQNQNQQNQNQQDKKQPDQQPNQQPSPMSKDGPGGMSKQQPGPSGGGNARQQPGGGRKGPSRKDRRMRQEPGPGGGVGQRPQGKEPGGMQPQSEPNGKKLASDGPGAGKKEGDPKGMPDRMSDVYKDLWGHLPDRLRQEMDLYYREKFMPRYSELLRRYYAALAEQKKSGSEDR